MKKCCQCHKTDRQEQMQIHGFDGDFIHKDCASKLEKEMDRVANMTDEEFENWMLS
jgi:hypothetical protein